MFWRARGLKPTLIASLTRPSKGRSSTLVLEFVLQEGIWSSAAQGLKPILTFTSPWPYAALPRLRRRSSFVATLN